MKKDVLRRTDMEVGREEVRRAVEKLKNSKAAGIDGIMAEVLKYGGEWMLESVWELCREVFEKEKIPEQWSKAVKVPIRKKGKGEEYGNYRGVTLLSVVGKVLAMVLEARLRLFLETKEILSDSQYGFRESRSTVDALFVLNETIKVKGGKAFVGFWTLQKPTRRCGGMGYGTS